MTSTVCCYRARAIGSLPRSGLRTNGTRESKSDVSGVWLPPGYHHSLVRIEVDRVPSLRFEIAVERSLRPAERGKGHRRGDTDVHADHADPGPVSELPRGAPARRKDRRGVAVAASVDHVDGVVERIRAAEAGDGPKISSRPTDISGLTDSNTVGASQWPLGYSGTLAPRPSRTSSAPSFSPAPDEVQDARTMSLGDQRAHIDALVETRPDSIRPGAVQDPLPDRLVGIPHTYHHASS